MDGIFIERKPRREGSDASGADEFGCFTGWGEVGFPKEGVVGVEEGED